MEMEIKMKHDTVTLTNNELEIMEIFWSSNKPMTSNDLAKLVPEWNNNGYLHSLLKKLELKGFIKKIDTVSVTTRTAKLYAAVGNKEDYAAQMLASLNIQSHSVSKIAYALAKEVSGDNKDEIILELEDILNKLKNSK